MRTLSVLAVPLALCAVLALTPDSGAKDSSAICPPEPKESAAREAEWNRALKNLTVLGQSLPPQPDAKLLMPVDGVRVRDVDDTWGAPREGAREHAGQDVFAVPGTFVRSATAGVVWRIGNSNNGGNWVYVLGAGGRRYYYAHLGRVNSTLREGQTVTTRTILGTVGNSGNASATPAHLHFSVFAAYEPGASCRFLAIDPLPLLRDR